MSLLPDGLKATNVPRRMLIRMAYGVADDQISAAPAWVNANKYDLEAKADGSPTEALPKLGPGERKLVNQRMLQALLAQRFGLILRVTKELPIYALVVAERGRKLHVAKPGDTYADDLKAAEGHGGGPGTISTREMPGGRELLGQGISGASLAQTLTQELGRSVVAKTGLTGIYDVELQWSRDENPGPMLKGPEARQPAPARFSDSSEASLFAAIQEQLGLKLDSEKGPVEILVMNHAEKPSEN